MIAALIPLIGSILDKIIPDPQQAADAKLKAIELAQRGELAVLDADMKLALGQLGVNQAEAGNSSIFVSGWRPYIGWVCGAALTYQFILRPLGLFAAAYFGHPVNDAPGLDDTLWQLLFGMLGLGGLRTFEKVKGVAK
jgi:hypothetical protein